jgi:hypothetical protein
MSISDMPLRQRGSIIIKNPPPPLPSPLVREGEGEGKSSFFPK